MVIIYDNSYSIFLVVSSAYLGGMMMVEWKKRLEELEIYFLFLILLNLLRFFSESKMAWAVTIFFLFICIIISEWIRRGPLVEKAKNYLDKKGIRIIHLWVGITAVYYVVVGIVELIS